MSERSEELRLADALDVPERRHFTGPFAAIKLRQLHVRINELQENLEKKSIAIQRIWKERDELRTENEALRAQRDALLEALRFYAENMGRRTSDNEPFLMTAIEYDCGDRARAAIAKAEGKE